MRAWLGAGAPGTAALEFSALRCEHPTARALMAHPMATEVNACRPGWRNTHWTWMETYIVHWNVPFHFRVRWHNYEAPDVVFYVDPETALALEVLIEAGAKGDIR